MFREPPKSAPRISGTVPPVRGAGEVDPLPRGRTPAGTAAHGVPVRISTALREGQLPTLMGVGPSVMQGPAAVVPAPPQQAQTLLGIGDRLDFIKTTRDLPNQAPEVFPAGPTTSDRSPVRPRQSATPQEEGPPRGAPILPQAALTTLPQNMPVAAPFEAQPTSAKHADMTAHAPWFEDSDKQARIASRDSVPASSAAEWRRGSIASRDSVPASSAAEWRRGSIDATNEAFTGTQQIPRMGDWKRLAGKLIAPMLGLVILGIFVGGYFAFDGEGGKPRTPKPAKVAAAAPAAAKTDQSTITVIPQPQPKAAPAAAAAPAPAGTAAAAAAPVPTVAAAPAPAAASSAAPTAAAATSATPELVDVRIDSKPSGATVMLVDRGKTTFLGNTPITTSLDPARQYDVVFLSAGQPTRVEHIDPRTTKRVEARLGRGAAKRSESRLSSDNTTAPALAKTGGTGTLMISTKPPCEIFVDGKPTGLMTPQRAIMLPAGTHKITLVNQAGNVKKTIAVAIAADQATKVIQDLLQ